MGSSGPWRNASKWRQILDVPYRLLGRYLYNQRQAIIQKTLSPPFNPIKVICISDTHNARPPLPVGDLLIHAGDLTRTGTAQELQEQLDWLDAQPSLYKVIIAGNHDHVLDETLDKTHPCKTSKKISTARRELRWGSVRYLQRESIRFYFPSGRTLRVYGDGSTWKVSRGAFRHKDIRYWQNSIPRETEVLITHSPPRFHLDHSGTGAFGLDWELRDIKPMLHVFGHIHADYGMDVLEYGEMEEAYFATMRGSATFADAWKMWRTHVKWRRSGKVADERTILINASIMRKSFSEPMNRPWVVEI